MAGRINIALYDPIVRRRAALCHQLTDPHFSVLPFENAYELQFALHNNLYILIYDDFKSTDALIESIYRLGFTAPIIAYSERLDPQRVAEVIFYGAVDYLPGTFDKNTLMFSLTQVDARSRAIGNARHGGHRALAKLDLLTPREHDVLLAVAEGLSNEVIGKRLSISPRTVESHRANVLKKLDAKNSAEAVRIAFEAKLLSAHPREGATNFRSRLGVLARSLGSAYRLVGKGAGRSQRGAKALNDSEMRGSTRSQTMLLAAFWVSGDPTSHQLRVRDISATGLRGVTATQLTKGQEIVLEIRGVGKVEGRIVWASSELIGVQFGEPINPESTRIPVSRK